MTFYYYNDTCTYGDSDMREYPEDNAATEGVCVECESGKLRPSCYNDVYDYECPVCYAQYSTSRH